MLAPRYCRTLLLVIMARGVCRIFSNPTFTVHRGVLPTACFDSCDCSLSDSWAMRARSCGPGSRCRVHEPYACTALLVSFAALNELWCAAQPNILQSCLTRLISWPTWPRNLSVCASNICVNNSHFKIETKFNKIWKIQHYDSYHWSLYMHVNALALENVLHIDSFTCAPICRMLHGKLTPINMCIAKLP